MFGAITGTPGQRIGGQEFIKRLGGPDSAMAGLAADVVLDPLNLLGVGVLTKAGRAVRAAGRLDRAGEFLTRAAQIGKASEPIVTRADDAARAAGTALSRLSRAEIAGKPLIRPRAATRFGTARQIASGLDNADDATELLSKLKGLEDAPLSKDIGIGLPFMNPMLSFNVPGGARARDVVDKLVLGAKFSLPGRALRAGFDSSVSGQLDEAGQVFATGAKTLADDAVARKTREGVESAMRLRTGSEVDPFSDEGNMALGDLIERPAGKEVAEEFAEDPAVKAYVDWWDKEGSSLLEESRQVGIGSAKLDDPNVSGYLPRSFSPIAEDAFRATSSFPAGDRLVTSVASGDQMARADFMKIPGGRSRIVELSRDPDLVGPKKLPTELAAKKIREQVLMAGDAEAVEKSRKLASLLGAIDPDKMPGGLFSENPVDAITSYMKRRGRAIENARNIGEYVATKAVKASDGIADEASITVKDALARGGVKELGGDTLSEVREAIARTNGVDPDSISLTDYVVPRSVGEVVGRSMTRAPEKSHSIMSKGVETLGRLWRNSILAYPSRYSRDLVGGLFVNNLEGAASLYGQSGAWSLLRGKSLNGASFLRKIPRYANITDDAALNVKFYSDLAATGLADGMLRYDMGVVDATRTTLPGIDAIAPNKTRMLTSALGAKGGVPNLLNPDSAFYKETAALNDFVDIYNRLSGYLELLRQGVDPIEAGKRMKRAHVDYSGLTATEQAIKRYVPFYTYASRIAQETGRKLAENPMPLVRSMRTIEAAPEIGAELLGQDEAGYIPTRYREKVAIPLSSNARGKTVLYNADFPGIETLNDLGSGNPLRPLSGVSPQVGYAIETLTGRDTYTGQPLGQRRTPLGRIFGGDNDLTRAADRVLEMGPIYPRFSRLAADLVEGRSDESPGRRAVQTAVNALTGARIRDMPNEYLQNQLGYELDDALEPYTKTYEQSYIPADELAQLPPEIQAQYAALQAIRKARRKAAR